jgi:hypothetical protein
MALANRGQVPPEYITVETELNKGSCCVKYWVTIATDKSDSSIDVEQAKQKIFDALKDDPIYQVQREQDNGALSSSSISFMMMGAAAFLAF